MPARFSLDQAARGEFNIRDFGARQDGSTDDWAAIQEAIIEAAVWQSAGGDRVGKVIFPSAKATTIVTKELLVPNDGLVLEGASPRGVLLDFQPAGAADALQSLFRFEKRYGYMGPDTSWGDGDSGTSDAGSTSTTLVDAGQNFLTTCREGYIVHNLTKSTSTRRVTARVTAVNSNESLSHTTLTDGLLTYSWSEGDSFKVYPVSMLRFWRMHNFSIQSSNTSHFKCALYLHDCGSFLIEQVDIRNFWGNNSHGVWVRGREQGVFRQVTVNGAVIPLHFTEHTHHETPGINGNDLMLFEQCLFTAGHSTAGTANLGAGSAHMRPVIRAQGVPTLVGTNPYPSAANGMAFSEDWTIGSGYANKWVKNKTKNKYARIYSSEGGYSATTPLHGANTSYVDAAAGDAIRITDYPHAVCLIDGNAGLMNVKFDTVCFIGGEAAVFQYADSEALGFAPFNDNKQINTNLTFDNCRWEQPDYDATAGYETQAVAEYLLVSENDNWLWKNVAWRSCRFQTVGNNAISAGNASSVYLHRVHYASVTDSHFDFGASAGGTYLNLSHVNSVVWLNNFSFHFTGTPVVLRSTGVRKLLAIAGEDTHPMPILGVWGGATEVARTTAGPTALTARPYKRTRHSNAGAAVRVDLTLPSGQTAGNLWDEHEFNIRADQTIRLLAGHASDRIGSGAAGKYLDLSGRNTRCVIRLEATGHWTILENTCTLTWEP